jgi:hypothetical protein
MLLRCAAPAHRVRLPACRAQYDTPQPAYPTRTPFQTRTPPPPAPGEQLREPRLGLRLLLEPRPPAPPPLVEQLCCASQTGALHGTAAATHRLPDALRRAVRGSCTRAQKHSVPSAAAGGSRSERSCWCHTARRPLRRQLWHTARHLGSRRRGRRWLTVVAAEEALRRRRCGGGCCGGGCCGGRSRRRALAADHARGWAPETKGRDSRPRLRAGFFSPRRLAAHLHGQVAVFVLSLSGPSENGTVGLSVDPEKTGPSVDISCFQLFVYFRSSVSLS